MKYIENDSNDVYFNLALEEYIFNKFKNDSYLMFWINERSIVLGRNQNAFEEINIKAAEENDIKVARRNTGGGTVFHDSGNLNYTFITDYDPNELIDYDKFLNPIIAALASLGIQSEKRKISDIAIDGKKISGSAQSVGKGRVLHHGTLLFDADLSMLQNMLKPTEGRIVSRAVKSVRSAVTNIKAHIADRTMTIDHFKLQLINAFFPEGVEKFTLSLDELKEIKERVQSKYSQWEWNFGRSPKFSFLKESKILGQSIKLKLDVEKGIISSCEIIARHLPSKEIETIVNGSMYSYSKINERLFEINKLKKINNISIEELASCFF